MNRGALWLLQAGAAALLQPSTRPRPIVVRPSPGVERSVAVETTATGEFVRADQLASALGGSVAGVREHADRTRLRVGTVTFELTADVAFAKVGSDVVPLVEAPHVADGHLRVPVQFVTDVLPRVARSLLYDADRRELRAFQTVAAARPAAATPTPRQTPSPVVVAPRVTEPVEVPVESPRVPTRSRDSHIVVVDAGHGGHDSGMHGPLGGGPQVDEKDVTLAVARQVREALRARGVTVIMTRSRDTLIALSDRGRIANEQHGELFVSIHVNAANPTWRDAAGARGFETYFLADAKSEDARRVAALENESTRFETGPSASSSDPLGFIVSDMAQNEHLRESSRFAALVQRRLAKAHPGPSRGVKQAGFKVLVTASMPAVLVEVGYGTNPDDSAFMSSARGQQAIAAAIADAAVEYLSRSDRTAEGPAR